MQRNGAGDYLVIAPTYPIIDNKARPALKRYLNRTLGPGAYHSSGDIWTLTPFGCMRLWGEVPDIESRILFRHGTNPDAIEAFDAKGIHADEPGAMDDELDEAMQARVSIGRYRILYTSRPFRWNWYVVKIWNRVMDKFHRRKKDAPEDIEVINFPSNANPGFSDEEFEEQQAKLPEWKFDLKYRGIPTKPAGSIYSCFDREKCTVKRTPIDDRWQRAAGHDFGKNNTAGVWAYRHPTRVSSEGKPAWVIYSTYHAGDLTEKEHVDNFLYGQSKADPSKWRVAKKRETDEWDNFTGYKVLKPWAWGGNLTDDHGWRGSFTANGYPIMEPPINAVEVGIEAVFAMLKTGELLVCEDLEKLIADFENYSNEVDEEGEIKLDESGRPKIDQKSKWHRMDAVRALCVGLSLGLVQGEPKARVVSERSGTVHETHGHGGEVAPRVERRGSDSRKQQVASGRRTSARNV